LHNSTSILNEIHTKIQYYNEQVRNYLKDIIIITNKKIGIEKIVSIIIFGSQLPKKGKVGESTAISDCDLLIVFEDNVLYKDIKNLEKYFITLEKKHNFREFNNKNVSKLLEVVHQSTGMFVSHFLTHRKHWENLKFHNIFRVNRIFSKLFAPEKIVLCNIIENSSVIYGIDLRENVKNRIIISPFDLIKSLIMNLLISVFAIFIVPFKSLNSPKYILEATKWALKASNYYIFEDSRSLDVIIRRFQILEKSKNSQRRTTKFYRNFLDMRRNPNRDFKFMLQCPYRILKIHMHGAKRKMGLKFKEKSLKISSE